MAEIDLLTSHAGWEWGEGLHPSPDAPVWQMDTFRDRFLAAYGSARETGLDATNGR